MCEFCSKTEVTIEKLAAEEQSPCEWISEEEGPGACDQQAAYAVSEWYVEDHYATFTKRTRKKRWKKA
jgi:hypothetical protein